MATPGRLLAAVRGESECLTYMPYVGYLWFGQSATLQLFDSTQIQRIMLAGVYC